VIGARGVATARRSHFGDQLVGVGQEFREAATSSARRGAHSASSANVSSQARIDI